MPKSIVRVGHTHSLTLSQTNTHTHTHTHRTRTHTHTHNTYTYIDTHACTHTQARTHTRTHTHTNSLSLSLTHTHALTHTNIHTNTISHPLSHTHAREARHIGTYSGQFDKDTLHAHNDTPYIWGRHIHSLETWHIGKDARRQRRNVLVAEVQFTHSSRTGSRRGQLQSVVERKGAAAKRCDLGENVYSGVVHAGLKRSSSNARCVCITTQQE